MPKKTVGTATAVAATPAPEPMPPAPANGTMPHVERAVQDALTALQEGRAVEAFGFLLYALRDALDDDLPVAPTPGRMMHVAALIDELIDATKGATRKA